jgi:hypothetical protein
MADNSQLRTQPIASPSRARPPSRHHPTSQRGRQRIRRLAWITTVFLLTGFLVQNNVRLALREGADRAILPTAATLQISVYWQQANHRTASGAARTTVLDRATTATTTTTTTAGGTMSPQRTSSALTEAKDSANIKGGQLSTAGASSAPIVYSILRPDRSGAIILDMLFAHAYAYSKNLTYGGACDLFGSNSSSSSSSSSDGGGGSGTRRPTHQEDAKDLVRAVGLENVLRFECPADSNETNAERTLLPRETYVKKNLATFTRQYLLHVRSHVAYPPRHHPGNAVVHVRRGDVTPCSPSYANRYLPNSHYVDILQQMIPRNASSVTILSESDAFESPEQDFAGHELRIDTALSSAWLAMMTADHVVLSKSSFSFVPALLNPSGKVYYTPYLQQKLPDWIRVPKRIQKRSRERVRSLIHERCADEDVKRAALLRLDI